MIVTREFRAAHNGSEQMSCMGVRMDQPDPGRSGQHGPGGTAALDHPGRATSTHASSGGPVDAPTGDAPTGDALASGHAMPGGGAHRAA